MLHFYGFLMSCRKKKLPFALQVYGTSISGDVDNQRDLQDAFDDLFVQYGVIRTPISPLPSANKPVNRNWKGKTSECRSTDNKPF